MMKTENNLRVDHLEEAWKKAEKGHGDIPIWYEYLSADCNIDFLIYVLEMDIEQRVKLKLPGLIAQRYWEHQISLGKLTAEQKIALVRGEVLRKLAYDDGSDKQTLEQLESQYSEAFPDLVSYPQWQAIPWLSQLSDTEKGEDTNAYRNGPSDPSCDLAEGYSIGPYRLVKRIAEGGMGEVWMADQQEPVKRRIALKLIKGIYSGSREILTRFEVERQALALMNHPNIARILDAGSTVQGEPYFVMEYVPGLPLTDYCNQNRLPVEERLRLFGEVCHGIQHAHQKAIIHRDLKPSNILVAEIDGKPVPKIIDFGLAKALENNQRLTEKSMFTGVGQILGTLKYMSPEQASLNSADIDVRTDVYSLGVILYELLVGSAPLEDSRIREQPVIQLLETIRNDEAQRPSGRLRQSPSETRAMVSRQRRIDPSKLQSILTGDLDWVVMRAIETNRDRRYSSAAAFGEDVRSYLMGQPVAARPPSLGYRLSKFSRRNRVLLIATCLIALGLLGTSWGLFRAYLAEQQSQQRALSSLFQQGLEEKIWSKTLADKQEKLAIEIEQFAPMSGREAKEKLSYWTVECVREKLRQSRVTEEDRKLAEPAVAWLYERNAVLANKLRAEIEVRFNDWQPSLEISPPFDNIDQAFDRANVITDGESLGLIANSSRFIVTRVDTSSGRLKVRLEVDGDWRLANKIGLIFNHPLKNDTSEQSDVQDIGYEFLLLPAESNVTNDGGFPINQIAKSSAKENFTKSEQQASLAIYRNGLLLQSKKVVLDADRLVLIAEREGDRLGLFVNEHTLVFTDDLPLTADRDAVLALYWPQPAKVTRLKVENKAIALAASPLEKADAFFIRRKYSAALEEYELQRRLGKDAIEEANVKAGMCLIRLNRIDEALKILEPMVNANGERWPIIAATELWLLRLRQKDYENAEFLFEKIKLRFTSQQLSRFVSVSVREELAKANSFSMLELILRDPKTIPQLESKLEVADLLGLPDVSERYQSRLLVTYAFHGNYEKVLELSEKLMPVVLARFHRSEPLLAAESYFYLARWRYWALRSLNRSKDAVSEMEQFMRNPLPNSIVDPPSLEECQKIFAILWLEQSRNYAALQDWKQAEAAVDRYLNSVERPVVHYMFYSQPYVMKGFLEEKLGKKELAEDHWKNGLWQGFCKQYPAALDSGEQSPNGLWGVFDFWIMASLSNSLSDKDGKELEGTLKSRMVSDPLLSQLLTNFQFSPAVIRGSWRTPKGREWAQRMAFFDMAPIDYLRVPCQILLYEKVRQDLFDQQPTVEQDDLAWITVQGVGNLVFEGKIDKTQLLQVGFAWKGLGGIDGVIEKVPENLKGECCYLMGKRYLKINKTAAASRMFQSAEGFGASNSVVKRLAKEELQRLEK